MSNDLNVIMELAEIDLTSVVSDEGVIDEDLLFHHVAAIIECRRARAGAYANREVTLMRWEVGYYIRSVLLNNERAEYGKQIVSTLSKQLIERFGNTFDNQSIRKMMRFAEQFNNFEIVSTLSTQLSWSHFVELQTLKTEEARMYYAADVMARNYGVRELRHQIDRKAFERREIANTELSEQSSVPFNVFKDPYLLDILGLKENYLEADLEKAVLVELEAFILEFGHGFAFVERQKRMPIGMDTVVLDLLFYHRVLKRLVAIELKMGEFQAAYKGQMELYLKWLDQNERQPDEEAPIGIILCATANREKVEMLQMDKAGIAVAEYWTALPPRKELEQKLREILFRARERLVRRESLQKGNIEKHIDYFLDQKGDEDE